jgi:hypothetical protein
MADESDYTQMWSGVFTPPRIGDDDRGVYLLDDETSVGRNGKIYDECTRVLYDDAHPRTHPGGQRYPGPYGGGRASDRVGPGFPEREAAARRRGARYAGEGFSAGPDATERALYAQGSRALGHPGPRGMVTSSREGRRAIDNAVWDNRPPHFADDTPNEFAHLYIDPSARGPPLFSKNPTYPGFRQVDRFGSSPAGSGALTPRDTNTISVEIVKVVLFIIIVVLAAMWLMVSSAEKRIGREVECALREAMLSRRAREAGGV